MKISVNTFKILLRLGSLGETFMRKDITKAGADSYIMRNLSFTKLIEQTGTPREWRLTDKAYREITEVEKLLEQVN